MLRLGLASPVCPIALTRLTQRTFASAASAVQEIHSDAEFAKVLQTMADKAQLGIVDFTAKWCPPCKAIAPHYEELSRQHPDVKFLKVDIDMADVHKTVNDHGITSVPTFTVYKGAKRVESFTGARLDYLKDVIRKHKASS